MNYFGVHHGFIELLELAPTSNSYNQTVTH